MVWACEKAPGASGIGVCHLHRGCPVYPSPGGISITPQHRDDDDSKEDNRKEDNTEKEGER